MRLVLVLALTMLLTGCVLAPRETRDEQHRLREAGETYDSRDVKNLPDLPAVATWQDVLHRALLANGELEAAYFEWKAAMAQIPQSAVWPNAMLAPSFGYLFS